MWRKKKETYLDETKYKEVLKNQKENGIKRLATVACTSYEQKGRKKK